MPLAVVVTTAAAAATSTSILPKLPQNNINYKNNNNNFKSIFLSPLMNFPQIDTKEKKEVYIKTMRLREKVINWDELMRNLIYF